MEETGRTGRYEKRVLFLTFLTFFFLLILSGTSTEAAQERDSQTQTSTSAQTQEELEQELLSEMDLAEIEQAVDGLLESTDFSFTEMLERLMSGEEDLSADTLGALIGKILTGTMEGQKKILVQLIVLVLACAFLSNLSGLFSEGQLWETSFYVVYLLVFVLLV